MGNTYGISIHYAQIMRISSLYICLQLFALYLFGAHNSHAQTISIDADKATVQQVFKDIEKQAKITFSYERETLADTKPLTLHLQNKPLKDVITEISKRTDLDFQQVGNVIVVNKKKVQLAPKRPVPENKKTELQPQQPIRGKVTDQSGNPIAGATIKVKGTSIVSVTDQAGAFILPAIGLNSTIEVTFLGYGTKKFSFTGAKTLEIALINSIATIQEIEVNAGYWKVNEKLRTGNISKVEGKTIQQQPVIDPMLALAGRVPGLVVSQNSGLPGAYHAVRIRGNNSLANGNDPLFLIDGLPFTSSTLSNSVLGTGATRISPFSLLNAEDIESIEVLKDADATAIYGSRGANGVILITTKKGREGKTAVNLSASTGFGKVNRMMDMLNTEQYLEMRREAFANDGITTYPANAYDVNGTWDQHRYTDWQKVLIGNTSRMTNIQGQISGGSALTQFLTGGGYTKETTVFPGDYNTKKGNVSLNLNHQSENKKFGFTLSTRFVNNFTDQPQIDLAANIISLAPNSPVLYDEQGNLNWEDETWDNPMAYSQSRSKLNSKNLIANTTLRYQIFTPLEVKLNVGYNNLSTLGDNITPMSFYRPSYFIYPDLRSHNRAESNQNTWIVEPQVNYNKEFGLGKLETTIGATFQKSDQYSLAMAVSNFSDDALLENIMAGANFSIRQNQQTEYRYAALFARANYNIMDRYLINLVARRDGSTRFAPGRKYGNFASLGAAWIFSNETIFKDSALSFGKFRISYGITGNDQTKDYQYLSSYSTYGYPYLGITGLYPTRLYTSDYGWEAVRKIEGALDLGFLADRIRLSTVYYRNRTDNQLVGYPLPTMTGFPSIQGNLPAVLENKGWEWELNTVNIAHSQFTWNTSFNISLPDSKLISYPDFEKSSYRNTYEIGKPLSISKAYHWTGVDPETGIHTFEDVDGDGNLTSPQDLQAMFNLGRRYYGGLSNSLSYKGLTIDILFQFVKKKGRIPMTIPGVAFVNQPKWVMDRWQKPGDITDVQRFTQSGTAFTTMVTGLNSSDMIYDDTSFLRLKNLSVSYQLPAKLVKSYWLTQCRIFAQCQNLLTFTRYRGLDPETETALPLIRMMTAGINLTL